MNLRHGHTLTDLNRYAHIAVARATGVTNDYTDRYDTAWSAIAEALYAADEPPTDRDLITAGRNAIWAAKQDHRHHHGYYRDQTGTSHGAHTSPAFQRYWITGPTPSPEPRIVERLALQQILPTLTPGQRDAVTALAVFGDHQPAKAAVGNSYDVQLSKARRRFLRWWHQHETPSTPWGKDRRRTTKGRGATAIIRRRHAARRTTPTTEETTDA